MNESEYQETQRRHVAWVAYLEEGRQLVQALQNSGSMGGEDMLFALGQLKRWYERGEKLN